MSTTATAEPPADAAAKPKTYIVETMDNTGHSEEELSAEEAFRRAKGKGSAVFAFAGQEQLGIARTPEAIPERADRLTVVPPQAGG